MPPLLSSLVADLSPRLQEAVFRHVLPNWSKRWPQAKVFFLALGNPLDPRSPNTDVIKKLNQEYPYSLAPYSKSFLQERTVVLGLALTGNADSRADIVAWGSGYERSQRLGREMRTEYLTFKNLPPGRDTWRFVGEIHPPVESLAVLTIPQSGATAICPMESYADGVVGWFWQTPDQIVAVKSLYPKSGPEIQDISLPSGRITSRCKVDKQYADRFSIFKFSFSRSGTWFSSWERSAGIKLYAASSYSGQLRVIPVGNDMGNPFQSIWISDDEWARLIPQGKKTCVTIYKISLPTPTETKILFDFELSLSYLPTGINQAGELVLSMDQSGNFIALHLDTNAPTFRQYKISLPFSSGACIFSPTGSKLAWMSALKSSDPNFDRTAVWISGVEGEGMKQLAEISIPENYRRDTGDAPGVALQWSSDERSLGFLRDGLLWSLAAR